MSRQKSVNKFNKLLQLTHRPTLHLCMAFGHCCTKSTTAYAQLSKALGLNVIDDFISKVKKISNDPESQKLISLLELWKENDLTVSSLENEVERSLGNSWISSEEEYRRIYSEWSKFRDNEIRGIDGMTMNERLFVFGIFDRFDNASSEQQKMVIYAKLHAKP